MKFISANPDLAQMAQDFIAANPATSMYAGAFILGAVIWFFKRCCDGAG